MRKFGLAGMSLVLGMSITSPVQALSPMEEFVLGGVYDEMLTCFGFTTVASAKAKEAGKAAEQADYEERSFHFFKSYDFFGKKAGRTQDQLNKDAADVIMRLYNEAGKNPSNMVLVKKKYRQRCEDLKDNAKPFMTEYMNRWNSGER